MKIKDIIKEEVQKMLEASITKGFRKAVEALQDVQLKQQILRKAFVAEKNPKNDAAWQVVNLMAKNLKPTFLEEEKTLSMKDQIKSDMYYNIIIKSEYYTNKINSALGD